MKKLVTFIMIVCLVSGCVSKPTSKSDDAERQQNTVEQQESKEETSEDTDQSNEAKATEEKKTETSQKKESKVTTDDKKSKEQSQSEDSQTKKSSSSTNQKKKEEDKTTKPSSGSTATNNNTSKDELASTPDKSTTSNNNHSSSTEPTKPKPKPELKYPMTESEIKAYAKSYIISRGFDYDESGAGYDNPTQMYKGDSATKIKSRIKNNIDSLVDVSKLDPAQGGLGCVVVFDKDYGDEGCYLIKIVY